MVVLNSDQGLAIFLTMASGLGVSFWLASSSKLRCTTGGHVTLSFHESVKPQDSHLAMCQIGTQTIVVQLPHNRLSGVLWSLRGGSQSTLNKNQATNNPGVPESFWFPFHGKLIDGRKQQLLTWDASLNQGMQRITHRRSRHTQNPCCKQTPRFLTQGS